MTIRTFQPGDEAAQVSIYNEASAELPKFKEATLDEIRRRHRSAEFDPGTRFFALAGDETVGYAAFHANGRVSYPWCRKGHEQFVEPLFQTVLEEMKRRGIKTAFAAYRGDWTAQNKFFAGQGFRKVREMVNFVLALVDMPTPGMRRGNTLSPLKPEDLPALVNLAAGALRTTSIPELERHFFKNPYFDPDSVFVMRHRADASLEAVGMLVLNTAYANPQQVDSAMPCFRLGAFGTEGMQAKRINGLFSFLAAPSQDAVRLGSDLLSHAAFRLQQQKELNVFAAQVATDVPHLLRFYEHLFRKQGSFPVMERTL